MRRLARPVPALILFNVLIVVTHWPAFVDFTLRSELAHFAAHAALFVSALLMWCPVAAPLPELRPLGAAGPDALPVPAVDRARRCPASFLVFAEKPIYHFYETCPGCGACRPGRTSASPGCS